MKNGIRLGKVSAIDYATGMIRVAYHEKDDSVTRLVPLLSDEYFMPEVGDQVLVLHLSNGSEAAVVLGRPWSEKNKPAEGSAGLYRKELARAPGTAMVRYKDGTLRIKASSIVLDGNVTITGNLSVLGDITVAGKITSTGDTVAGGKSLIGHKHTDSVGGSTTAPN